MAVLAVATPPRASLTERLKIVFVSRHIKMSKNIIRLLLGPRRRRSVDAPSSSAAAPPTHHRPPRHTHHHPPVSGTPRPSTGHECSPRRSTPTPSGRTSRNRTTPAGVTRSASRTRHQPGRTSTAHQPHPPADPYPRASSTWSPRGYPRPTCTQTQSPRRCTRTRTLQREAGVCRATHQRSDRTPRHPRWARRAPHPRCDPRRRRGVRRADPPHRGACAGCSAAPVWSKSSRSGPSGG